MMSIISFLSYLLPHLHSGWAVDQAILSEEDRVVVIRFGHDWDPDCMKMDEILYGIADKVSNFAIIFLVDISEVPDFNQMYELYDPCTTMFFFRNKHIMIDLGTGFFRAISRPDDERPRSRGFIRDAPQRRRSPDPRLDIFATRRLPLGGRRRFRCRHPRPSHHSRLAAGIVLPSAIPPPTDAGVPRPPPRARPTPPQPAAPPGPPTGRLRGGHHGPRRDP